MRLTSGRGEEEGRGEGEGDPGCCISMGAVQIPRDYWREKGGEEKNDARVLGSVVMGESLFLLLVFVGDGRGDEAPTGCLQTAAVHSH